MVKALRNTRLVENYCDLGSWVPMCDWKTGLEFAHTTQVDLHGFYLLKTYLGKEDNLGPF